MYIIANDLVMTKLTGYEYPVDHHICWVANEAEICKSLVTTSFYLLINRIKFSRIYKHAKLV